MIKKCYLTEFEQNILQQFGIVDQAKTEQLEFLQNVKIGNMEGGFNGFIWYGELVKFYQENREIIQDIYKRSRHAQKIRSRHERD